MQEISANMTHDDYWKSKNDIARLTDAFERGMLDSMPDTEKHLQKLIEKVQSFEIEHPYIY